MTVPYLRPRVADLVFRLFDRPLHPEFLDTLAVRRVERAGYKVAVHITPTGHALVWSDGRTHISEVTATRDQELPDTGGRLVQRFRGERAGTCDLAPGLRYRMGLQVEVLPPEQFLAFQAELIADGRRNGFAFHLRPANRLGVSPVGVVIAEALAGSLSVSAFHTFPDELAVIKTQSLIEWN